MASTRELRRRIKSVKSTRQITKAMEMVAAAKMRKASEATLASRPYVQRALQVLNDLASRPIEGLTHPLITDREVKRVLVFAISSDRGLAGSYNTNLAKQVITLVRTQEAQNREVHFITMGRKLERTIAKLSLSIIQSYGHTPLHPTSADVLPIAATLTEQFLSGKADQILVLYTDFHSLLNQEANLIQLLPVKSEKLQVESEKVKAATEFTYEPDPLTVLNTLLPRLMEAQLYQCLQESLASEHAARRLAMKNASDNASDMINDLNLTYNGIRQSTITRELAEITSGAEALAST